MQLILISGLSGSGKSIALKALEDSGFFCVDNLPVEMLAETGRFLHASNQARTAISVDIRSGASLSGLPAQISSLRALGIDVRLLYLESSTAAIVKRFSESRRPHPLNAENRSLTECTELERERLAGISDLGHRIDTSELHPNTLRTWVRDFAGLDESRLTLMFQSFGFKHGIPLDADFVFDVRCLPNPYYDPELRPYTGRDDCIIAYLEAQEDVRQMVADIQHFVAAWLPAFIRDHRSYLTIAIGCTGGQHRSVYIAETLAAAFRKDSQILVRHRSLS